MAPPMHIAKVMFGKGPWPSSPVITAEPWIQTSSKPSDETVGVSSKPVDDNCPPHIIHIASFLMAIGLKVRKPWIPSLSFDAARHLKIACVGLDLERDTDPFFQPISMPTMTEWLQEAKPWETRGHGGWLGSYSELFAWEDAKALGYSLSGYAAQGAIAGKYGSIGFRDAKSSWKKLMAHPDLFGRRQPQCFDLLWALEGKDKSKPHLTAFLCADSTLHEDSLNSVEVWCILKVISWRLGKIRYDQHRVFPVSLISAAGRQCRILLAHVDLGNDLLQVRKSKIMDFDKERHYQSDEWRRLLCWMVAEPVGDTLGSHDGFGGGSDTCH